jgi:hypothetical protein
LVEWGDLQRLACGILARRAARKVRLLQLDRVLTFDRAVLAAIAIVPIGFMADLIQIWTRMQSPCSVGLVVRVPFPTSFAVLYGSIAAIRTDNTHCLRKLMFFLLARTLSTALVRRSSRSQTRKMSRLPFADLRARKIANSSSRVMVVISWFSRAASPLPDCVGITFGFLSTNEGFRRLNLATRRNVLTS